MNKLKTSSFILFIIMLIVGILISYSYQVTKETQSPNHTSSQQWEKEYEIRKLLIEQEKQNRKLQQLLFKKQQQVTEMEEKLKEEKQIYYNLVEDVEKLRMFVGEVGVVGQGIEVTLEDASYVPEGGNVNNYIVHESHLFKVINELLISGASAISINGQRLFHNTYIYCNGPVVTVDGNQYPAPFVIRAIGDPEVLTQALNIAGGVLDQLAYDNIVVKVEKKNEIRMEPLIKNQTTN
ncbi:DUF881 domain-containing protein [Aeribacillus alveayuensis]|uniref:Uncharacterized protein YlxW (UPF0749 family) n=1 Tax=Aeribacillus alveayuensis TaxID=279215 RepID=A0ABT9VL15_9BACI|nr:uncharacterized protein YlxW (UPF0749 family) [Bacillus alveayuensis]